MAETVSYLYDNSGSLATVIDSGSGITTTYYYDFIDRLAKYTRDKGTVLLSPDESPIQRPIE